MEEIFTCVPDHFYMIVGQIVVLLFTCLFVFLAIASVKLLGNKLEKVDIIHYYVLRRSIDTETLELIRSLKGFDDPKYYRIKREYCKYRLRNIKLASKNG